MCCVINMVKACLTFVAYSDDVLKTRTADRYTWIPNEEG